MSGSVGHWITILMLYIYIYGYPCPDKLHNLSSSLLTLSSIQAMGWFGDDSRQAQDYQSVRPPLLQRPLSRL
jgi:hypothetical protein